MVKSSLIISLLVTSSSYAWASRLAYRPPTQAQAPWHKPNIGSKAKVEEQYIVPDFGVDSDILNTQKHMADQEKTKGKWQPKQNEDGKWLVPEVYNDVLSPGTPSEIAVGPIGYKAMAQVRHRSDPVCGSSGCKLAKKHGEYRKDLVKFPDPDSMSYDEDIVDSQENEKKVFKKFKQTWNIKSGEDYENAYQMERDGLPWGGGYDDDSRSFVKNYAESLWGDKVQAAKKPAAKQTKKQQKVPEKPATSKAEIQDQDQQSTQASQEEITAPAPQKTEQQNTDDEQPETTQKSEKSGLHQKTKKHHKKHRKHHHKHKHHKKQKKHHHKSKDEDSEE